MSYVWKKRVTIAIGIVVALTFGFGLYAVLCAIGLNAGASFMIGWVGFGVAVLYIDKYFEQKERLEQKVQEELEAALSQARAWEVLRKAAKPIPTGAKADMRDPKKGTVPRQE